MQLQNDPLPDLVRFMIGQIVLGALVATALIVLLLAANLSALTPLIAEAARYPLQAIAIWLGAVAPFSVGFLGTALCRLGGRSAGPPGGRRLATIKSAA